MNQASERERACSVWGCEHPAVATFRVGAFVDERCAWHLTLPSARAALEAGVPVKRQANGRCWSIYPTPAEGGYSGFSVYPGDEGPQDGLTLGEALDAVGGDSECVLTAAGRVKWPTLSAGVQQRVLAGECPVSAIVSAESAAPDKLVQARVLNQAAAILSARGCTGLAASLREECNSVLRELL